MTSDPTSAPLWLARALEARPRRDDRALGVAGTAISTWSWPGHDGAPRLVLVHGGGAHAGWWSWTGPLLAPAWDVVAVELSGHGRSGRRPGDYSFGAWADEVLAAAGDGPAVLIGHSMGGVIVAIAAQRAGSDRVPAVVIVDAPLERPTSASLGDGPRRMAVAQSTETREALLARFRLVPDQDALHPAMLDHVAQEGHVEVEGRFAWRFDPSLFAASEADRPPRVDDLLVAYDGHVGAIVGGRSEVVPEEQRARLADCCRGGPGDAASTYVEVPDAHHQIMFDRPHEMMAALDGMLRGWGMPGVGPLDV